MFATPNPRAPSNIAKISPKHPVWPNCRDESYFLFRWGDPEWMRQYIKNMGKLPIEKVAGIYIGANVPWGR